jgi:hypothetical protein
MYGKPVNPHENAKQQMKNEIWIKPRFRAIFVTRNRSLGSGR